MRSVALRSPTANAASRTTPTLANSKSGRSGTVLATPPANQSWHRAGVECAAADDTIMGPMSGLHRRRHGVILLGTRNPA